MWQLCSTMTDSAMDTPSTLFPLFTVKYDSYTHTPVRHFSGAVVALIYLAEHESDVCSVAASRIGHVGILKENHMKSSTKDQAEGTFHELKGKVKEVAGKLSDNPKLEGEGLGEKMAGKVQKKVGQVEKVLEK
jgi:uncharacterized protein YjbJ (UPF0337 family)